MSEEPSERKPEDFLNIGIAIGTALMFAGIYFFQGLLFEDLYGDFTFTLAICTSSIFFLPGLWAFYLSIPKTKKQKMEDEEEYNRIVNKEIRKAKKHEKLLEFDEAALIYKRIGYDDDVVRVRKMKEIKVDQTVVQGDQVTKTEIKDSVLNRSNVGSGEKSKAEEIKEIKELLDSGAIDNDEFKQMKKEILGKWVKMNGRIS